MFCNRVIAIVTVLTIFCSMVVTIEKQRETDPAIDVEAGSAILIEANSGKILYEKMQMNHWQLLV